MNSTRKPWLAAALAVIIGALLLGTPGAVAQEVEAEGAQPQAEADTDAAVDEAIRRASERKFAGEIVVTAQKREQQLQEVPFAIQAMEGAALEEVNVRDLSEVMTFVPGASEGLSQTVGQRSYQIRGISQGSGDNPVGYYLDDSAFYAYGWFYAPISRTFDVERVEVLRGPQSTLYGNSNMGGTVRYIYNAPNLSRFEAHLRGGYSGTDGGEAGGFVDAAVSIPLVENKLALRLVGSYEDIGGYQVIPSEGLENTNPATVENLRASALWTPSDKVVVRLLYTKNQVDSTGGTLVTSLDPPVSANGSSDFNNNGYDLFAGTLEIDLGFAALSSTTTYIDLSQDGLTNWPFPPAPGGIIEFSSVGGGTALNNETRLVSQSDSVFQWLAGVFYSENDNILSQASNISDLIPDTDYLYTSESMSVFGEVSLDLLDGRLIPLVGLRYFEDDRSYVSTAAGGGPAPETFDSVNPRFNISYLPTDGSTYYLNIAKGFRSGGFNYYCAIHDLGGLPCQDAVDSDSLWSYELGTKQAMADNQVLLDVALYYQDWVDIRQSVPFFGLYADYQIGDAALPGIDVQLVYTPAAAPGFTLRANANWNDAHFTYIDPALLGVSGAEEGDRVPLVPEWTAALAASYSFQVSGSWMGQAVLSYTHIEPQLGSFASGNTVGDARDLMRARFGFDNGSFGVFLFGNNLLNENGAIYSQAPAGGFVTFSQDYPRQIGVELTYNFW